MTKGRKELAKLIWNLRWYLGRDVDRYSTYHHIAGFANAVCQLENLFDGTYFQVLNMCMRRLQFNIQEKAVKRFEENEN